MDKVQYAFAKGQLEVMDRILKIPHCCDEDDLLHGCACEMCVFKANLNKERFDLRNLNEVRT